MTTTSCVLAAALALVNGDVVHLRGDVAHVETIGGCVVQLLLSSNEPRSLSLKGLMVIEGTRRRCLVRLEAGGDVDAPAWCRGTIPGLDAVRGWRWQGQDLSLLGVAGREIFLFKRVDGETWRCVRPGLPAIDLHRMRPEARPSAT